MNIDIVESMQGLLHRAAKSLHEARKILAISHIDADGISAMAIVIRTLERLHKEFLWRNIHQLNSETINLVVELAKESGADIIIFSDLGTGQVNLIQDYIMGLENVEKVIILDHHLPSEERNHSQAVSDDPNLIEINPCQHGYSGSYDISGAGVSFLFALEVAAANADLCELAIVGATGDLQDYYGKGFSGINEAIIDLGVESGLVSVDKDLTFFGINTRPLLYLLQYATDPYVPGYTGDPDACYQFFTETGVPLKDEDDNWRLWIDLEQDEKQRVIQKLIDELLKAYEDPKTATGIIGNVVTLLTRPPRTEQRSAKEFSTLLNACGRNRSPEVGVKICLRDEEAFARGNSLLQQHRSNLASAIRRIEDGGWEEMDGIYLVNDPETEDTIIGIVIGMAQGSNIIPWDKPVIGVSTNTTDESPFVKISGRTKGSLVQKGVNLRDVFTAVAEELNSKNGVLIAEAGGHPMAAGAFVLNEYLEIFLKAVSSRISKILE